MTIQIICSPTAVKCADCSTKVKYDQTLVLIDDGKGARCVSCAFKVVTEQSVT